jgi:DNA-binding NarL/FixJ family response regulator
MDSMVKPPRVLLADDDPALLDHVRRLLEGEFEVVGTVEDGKALVAAAGDLHPDLCVTDISMPRLNGFQAARQLRKEQQDVRILFLTVHEEPVAVSEALAIGVCGYVLKRSAAVDLIPAMRQVLNGGCFVSPAVQGT